jgi:hypothetical protein
MLVVLLMPLIMMGMMWSRPLPSDLSFSAPPAFTFAPLFYSTIQPIPYALRPLSFACPVEFLPCEIPKGLP